MTNFRKALTVIFFVCGMWYGGGVYLGLVILSLMTYFIPATINQFTRSKLTMKYPSSKLGVIAGMMSFDIFTAYTLYETSGWEWYWFVLFFAGFSIRTVINITRLPTAFKDESN